MANPKDMKKKALFSPVGEKEVTRAIVSEFSRQLLEYAQSDVIIVGGGPSGLIAGRDLAREGHKVLIIERNNYLGGGFWLGGYLMNKVTLRSPAEKELKDMGVPCRRVEPGLFVADGPHACSKLIAETCDAGAKVANMTMFEDVVLRQKNRVAGVVINWSAISHLPREIACVDPVALESRLVIDASGHDAVVIRALERRGLITLPGCGAMWIEKSEDLVVEHTREVHPGLIVVGMAVSAVDALPRMGPTFGAMLISGRRGAELASRKLKRKTT
jgi:thiazole biosynthesis enzyme